MHFAKITTTSLAFAISGVAAFPVASAPIVAADESQALVARGTPTTKAACKAAKGVWDATKLICVGWVANDLYKGHSGGGGASSASDSKKTTIGYNVETDNNQPQKHGDNSAKKSHRSVIVARTPTTKAACKAAKGVWDATKLICVGWVANDLHKSHSGGGWASSASDSKKTTIGYNVETDNNQPQKHGDNSAKKSHRSVIVARTPTTKAACKAAKGVWDATKLICVGWVANDLHKGSGHGGADSYSNSKKTTIGVNVDTDNNQPQKKGDNSAHKSARDVIVE